LSDSRIAQAQRLVLSETAVQPSIEELKIEFWLSKAREGLTVDNPVTELLLGKDSPENLAQRLVAGTQLADPVLRRALWEGGRQAVQVSGDPLIRFALTIDRAAREVRTKMEDRVDGPRASAAARIAQARFAIYRKSLYPDATFTPRISFGAIEGWAERSRQIAPVSTFAGFYGRATGQPPFDLPDSWLKAKDNLDQGTPFNFVCTFDVVGGNSGSPTLNAKGEVIGAVFDGNTHMLGGDYGYDPKLNRSISVTAAAIQEALLKVYNRSDLVRELNDQS
jgi:Peptidase S46